MSRDENPKEKVFSADSDVTKFGVKRVSAIHGYLRGGISAGEQTMPRAPWRILVRAEARRPLPGVDAPEGLLSLSETTETVQTLRCSFGQYRPDRRDAETSCNGQDRRINVDSATCGQQVKRFYQMTNNTIREA